ncbi:MAG: hypothetical protein R3Y57_04040 [Erysipelotrichaceae bacterium]
MKERDYSDIIHLKRPKSIYPKMSLENRAAQFAPFSAVSGHHESIIEVARIVDSKTLVDEDSKALINQTLTYLQEHKHQQATFIVFEQDEKKTGGKQIEISGKVKKIDDIYQVIILQDKRIIELENLIEVTL